VKHNKRQKKMKSFKEHLYENMSNSADVHRQPTKDIAPLYKWLTQQSGKEVAKTNKRWAKTRDVIGREIAMRAEKGEKDAKAVYRSLALDNIYNKRKGI
jgi:glutathione peroxidase-family protein